MYARIGFICYRTGMRIEQKSAVGMEKFVARIFCWARGELTYFQDVHREKKPVKIPQIAGEI